MTTKTYSASDFAAAARHEDAWAKRADAKWDAEMVAEQHHLYAAALRIAARVMDGETIANVLQEPLVERELIAALTKDTTP